MNPEKNICRILQDKAPETRKKQQAAPSELHLREQHFCSRYSARARN